MSNETLRRKIASIVSHRVTQCQNTSIIADAILAEIIASVPELVWEGDQEDCYATCDMGSTGYELSVTDTLERSCDYVWQARFLECARIVAGLGGGTYEQAKEEAQKHHVAQRTGWMMK